MYPIEIPLMNIRYIYKVTYVMITSNGIYIYYKCGHNFNVISVLIIPGRKWVITMKPKTYIIIFIVTKNQRSYILWNELHRTREINFL